MSPHVPRPRERGLRLDRRVCGCDPLGEGRGRGSGGEGTRLAAGCPSPAGRDEARKTNMSRRQQSFHFNTGIQPLKGRLRHQGGQESRTWRASPYSIGVHVNWWIFFRTCKQADPAPFKSSRGRWGRQQARGGSTWLKPAQCLVKPFSGSHKLPTPFLLLSPLHSERTPKRLKAYQFTTNSQMVQVVPTEVRLPLQHPRHACG